MSEQRFTIGADPELLLLTARGLPKSAIGLIGGTKQNPKPFGIGHVQEDNVMVEFNIPPANNRHEFQVYISEMMTDIKRFFGKKDLYVGDKGEAFFDPEELNHPNALAFGCEPDYDVWEMKENPKPIPPSPEYRCCGGHIHLGFDTSKYDIVKLTKLLDLYVGVPLAVNDPNTTRKQFYGKAGCIRITEYGLEYRTPSNYWVVRGWAGQVYDLVDQAFDMYDYIEPNEVREQILGCLNLGLVDQVFTLHDIYKYRSII